MTINFLLFRIEIRLLKWFHLNDALLFFWTWNHSWNYDLRYYSTHWKGKKKSGDMKVFHTFSLFLALILFIFVPKCNCEVNILQHTVDDVKMPKTNFLHTTYISENNMDNVLNFMISILKSKWWQKQVQLKKKSNPTSPFRVSAAEC